MCYWGVRHPGHSILTHYVSARSVVSRADLCYHSCTATGVAACNHRYVPGVCLILDTNCSQVPDRLSQRRTRFNLLRNARQNNGDKAGKRRTMAVVGYTICVHALLFRGSVTVRYHVSLSAPLSAG